MKRSPPHKEPPPSLPREFHQIWAALNRADQEARSRQDLARQLSISTSTIQRILVRGDVPNFTSTQSTRVVRSWARLVARLARAFGESPADWVDMVGIPRDDAIDAMLAPDGDTRRRRPATGTVTSPFCQSCSVSLHEHHNQGHSHTYCRYCSDEHGELRPRREVETLIADWLRTWQADLDADDARVSAKLLMQAMPAWRSR